MTQERPDLQLSLNRRAKFNRAPSLQSKEALTRLLRHIKGTTDEYLFLVVNKNVKTDQVVIDQYTDSERAGSPDRKSTISGAILAGSFLL